MSQNILFIGGGNMASSIIAGLISNGWSSENIMVTDPDSVSLGKLADKHQVKTSPDNNKFIADCKAIVLAVKPQVLRNVALDIKDTVCAHKPIIISIVAGIKTASLKNWLAHDIHIIRAMPNTPALVQQGITGLFADENVPAAAKDLTQNILQTVGDVVWVENEDLINIVTAISGSGPAYFFLLFEAMQSAALDLGLDKNTAKKLITKTALGAAVMAGSQEISFADLRENVTSSGGTTEKALNVFADENFKQIVDKALNAAYARSVELAKQLDE